MDLCKLYDCNHGLEIFQRFKHAKNSHVFKGMRPQHVKCAALLRFNASESRQLCKVV